jgi:hypothetical protein
VISKPKDALSNADIKFEKYYICGRNLKIIFAPFERESNFGLEITFYDSQLISLIDFNEEA